MTDREKTAGSRSENAKDATGKDNKDNSAITDAERIGPKEVFDSSKYSAMSDMTNGSNLETKNVETLSDTGRATKDLRSGEVKNELITTPREETGQTPDISDSTTATETARITPMTFEERARTIREVNEEKSHEQS